jgi:hypothetical protein
MIGSRSNPSGILNGPHPAAILNCNIDVQVGTSARMIQSRTDMLHVHKMTDYMLHRKKEHKILLKLWKFDSWSFISSDLLSNLDERVNAFVHRYHQSPCAIEHSSSALDLESVVS